MHGGCHCGTVRFRIDVDPDRRTLHCCNCSICEKTAYLHLLVPAASFHLERGEEALTEYRFNSQVARHVFCRHCGVKSFYVPRSNPDGISVNARCLDQQPAQGWAIEDIDGRNWERAVATAGLERWSVGP